MDPSTSSSPALLSTPLIGSDAIDRKDAPVGSIKYYSLCGMGGALACGLTTSLYPKEIVVAIGPPSKFTMPIHVVEGVRGAAQMRRALSPSEIVYMPTVARCWKKGVAKFGLYDGFKDLQGKLAGDEAREFRIPIYMVSAVWSQALAGPIYSDKALIRMAVLTAKGKKLSDCEREKVVTEQTARDFPHYLRRIRNAMIQFPCYELAVEALYGQFKPKTYCNASEQLAVTFTAGCIAGLTCALVTHSNDTRPPTSLGDKYPYAAAAEHLTLASRSARMTAMVALQWTIYEGFKIVTGISNQPTRFSAKNQSEMPESLRKKLEESKLKKMKEQKPSDLQYPLTGLPMDPSTSSAPARLSTPLIRKEEKEKLFVPSLQF